MPVKAKTNQTQAIMRHRRAQTASLAISAAELVGSLVKSDFEELVDFAEAITRLRTAVEPVSLAEMRRKLGFDGLEG